MKFAYKLAKMTIVRHRFSNENKTVGEHFVSFQEEASSVTLVTSTNHKSNECTCLLM